MSELTRVMAQSGALDPSMLQEFAKWKLPIEVPDDDPLDTAEEVVEAIEAAVESQEQVEIRATDLDVLRQYMRTQAKGKLHISTELEKGSFPVTYGTTKFGEYIIPWQAESLVDYLTNGESHLKVGGNQVYFATVQELFFGDRKVFILCTPRRK